MSSSKATHSNRTAPTSGSGSLGAIMTTDITALSYGGRGIGRVGGKVVFVPYTVPGDSVEVEVTGEKRGFLEGRVQRLITPSPDRAEPFCSLFGRCGGCQWQHIPYRDQVAWKERIFRESLERIGGIKGLPLESAVAAESERGYRTRAQFHVQSGRWGFFAATSNDVVELDDCPLLDPLLNKSFNALRAALSELAPALPLHTVEVGVSGFDEKAVAILHITKEARLDLDRLMDSVPDLKGVDLRVTPLMRRGGRTVASVGDGCITYRVGGLMMRSHLSAFSQVNLGQNERLVDTVLDYADPGEGDSVVDLFSGAGNLSLPLAERCGSVTAIERDGVAVRDGILNSEAKEMGNVTFLRNDAAGGLMSLEIGTHDIVLLDPPRGGALSAVREIAKVNPGKIVYLSCNPSTLARDLSFLVEHGYRMERATTIDMFPHTYHIEGIVKLNHV
ncbi:MAG: 23S rRNA (uracil(1939)-C(5))-methyltransferase RlmD [Deltaproteobacteria bacterium]|nr:23S rRNA (uracil(1939)-C(5))-methyltransferase RlmD [Deltaproteobacteria bacterium]